MKADSMKKPERQMQNEKPSQIKIEVNSDKEKNNLSQSMNQIPYENQQQVNRSSQQKYGTFKVPQALKRNLKNSSNTDRRNENENAMTEMNANIMKWLMRLKQCPICQTVTKEQNISLSNCQHTFCKNCLDAYVHYNIQSSKQIRCPDQSCDALFNENSIIFEGLPQVQKKRYLTQKAWRQTQKDPNKKLCPRQNCQNGVVNLLANPPICNSCQKTFCIECELQAHQGPCQQKFQQMNIGLKRCPQCKMFIQKTEGCNHMTCKCGHQFCYVCLANWENSHYQCQGIGTPYFDFNAERYNVGNMTPQNCCFRFIVGIIMLIFLPAVIWMIRCCNEHKHLNSFCRKCVDSQTMKYFILL